VVTRNALRRWADENEVELVFFDPPEQFDHAILGLIHGFGQAPTVVYDEEQVLAAMQAGGMDQEEALEWFEFNTIGAYVGEATPRFLIRPWEPGEEAEESDVEET